MVFQISKTHNQTSTNYVFLILQWYAIHLFIKGKKKYFFQTICNFQTTTKKISCQCIWYAKMGVVLFPVSRFWLICKQLCIHNNILMPTNTMRKQILHKWSEPVSKSETSIITGGNLMSHDLLCMLILLLRKKLVTDF